MCHTVRQARYTGDSLYNVNIDDSGAMTRGITVSVLSNSMHLKLAEWSSRGYEVESASVRFIVAWKPKDAPVDEAESAVILADLKLRKG